jgi:hypothetical protein
VFPNEGVAMGDGGVIALAKIIAPRQDAKTGTWMFGGSIQELGLSGIATDIHFVGRIPQYPIMMISIK